MATKKGALAYKDFVEGIKKLEPEEQLSLVELISVRLKKLISGKKKKHSIMELAGLGAEIWKGVDAQEYVRNERSSWG